MALKTERYVRKAFAVDAVEVTEKNMRLVAEWCGGEIKRLPRWDPRSGTKFISVNVVKPISERQTQAFVGDWVLSSNTGPNGFKVYTPRAFETSFEKVAEHMVEVVGRMEERVAREEAEEDDEESDAVAAAR
jgi:hypothetical protein